LAGNTVYELKSAKTTDALNALCQKVEALVRKPPNLKTLKLDQAIKLHKDLKDLIDACQKQNVGRTCLSQVDTHLKPMKRAVLARVQWLQRDLGAAPLVPNQMQAAG
jgi:hypothetical protein